MDKQHVFLAHFLAQLPHRFQIQFVLHVADRAADLDQADVRLQAPGNFVEPFLDHIRHVRNQLHGLAEIKTFPFLIQDGFVNLAHGQVPFEPAGHSQKAFVMAEVHVHFAAVIQHENLAVLDRIHRSRIGVEIPVALDGHNHQTRIEQLADGGSRNPFSQTRYHASGNHNVFGMLSRPVDGLSPFPAALESGHRRRIRLLSLLFGQKFLEISQTDAVLATIAYLNRPQFI